MRMNAVRATRVSVERLLSGAAVTARKTMLVVAVARASEGYPPLFVSKNLQITCFTNESRTVPGQVFLSVGPVQECTRTATATQSATGFDLESCAW